MEKKHEDRINRQLRKTLVIRNLPEKDSEKWADTTDILANKISSLLEMSLDDAYFEIDRCHRGGISKNYKGKSKVRPIYAAMLRWETCEKLVEAARSSGDVYIDYKFGPLTTLRRNEALKVRKELKRSGVIEKGFIKFPAILMGKKPGAVKYEEIRNFSDDDVSSYKRD